MNTVFADTCFYIALLRPVDDLHLPSKEFDRGYRGLYVTSEYVLIELGNWFAETAQRQVFVELARCLRAEPRTTVVPADPSWTARGLDLYATRLDKQWSLTDCISFEMMRHHGLTDALSADRHFTQAGFHAVLAEGVL